MARINIEDSLWGDARFMRLVLKMGCERLAAGTMLVAYKTAQKYWLPDKKPIPLEIWDFTFGPKDGELLLLCGLAESRENGIYIRGSEEQFAWWFHCLDAGKKGGRPKQLLTHDDDNPSVSRGGARAKGAEPSSSSSSSSSKKKIHNTNTLQRAPRKTASQSLPESGLGSLIWEGYRKAYEGRYSSPPLRNAKTNALCKQLAQRLPAEAAPEVAAFFVAHPDPFYLKNLHPLTLLLRDAEKIYTEWKTGKHSITNRSIERQSAIVSAAQFAVKTRDTAQPEEIEYDPTRKL